MTRERASPRVIVHRTIAVGDFVWAHVNFLNLFTDDPDDTGVAGVDIYRMDTDGKAIEHWEVLQLVGEKLGPLDRTKHPAHQFKRHVLSGRDVPDPASSGTGAGSEVQPLRRSSASPSAAKT
jgi:predicted SnoaL-like aldol condensation-catalyzing enzyme